MPNLEKRADCINLLLSKASKYMLAPSSRCVFSSLPLIGCSVLPIVSSVKNHSTSLFPSAPQSFFFSTWPIANGQQPTAALPTLRPSGCHFPTSVHLILYSSYTHPILILYLSYTFPYPRTPALPHSPIPFLPFCQSPCQCRRLARLLLYVGCRSVE